MLGFVPLHDAQNRKMSALVSCPLTPAVNVWATHEEVLNELPLPELVVCETSTVGVFNKMT